MHCGCIQHLAHLFPLHGLAGKEGQQLNALGMDNVTGQVHPFISGLDEHYKELPAPARAVRTLITVLQAWSSVT